MADADSRASTPRASVKQSRNAGVAGMPKKTKKRISLVTHSGRDEKPTKEDTPTKSKKVRRILSDSEASSDEGHAAPATSRWKLRIKNRLLTRSKMPPKSTELLLSIASLPRRSSRLTRTPRALTLLPLHWHPRLPCTSAKVKKEEPRVKLSLAEYKRRLAERRVSSQQVATSSSGP